MNLNGVMRILALFLILGTVRILALLVLLGITGLTVNWLLTPDTPREPRRVWMTYEDGLLPLGRNRYLSATDLLHGGSQGQADKNAYAAIVILSTDRHPSMPRVKQLLSSSLQQCREHYLDAFRLGILQESSSLKNVHLKPPPYKPEYLVFLLEFGPTHQRPENKTRSDCFGTVIQARRVFDESESAASIANSALITPTSADHEQDGDTPVNLNWSENFTEVVESFESRTGKIPSNRTQ
ncbi:MULTISPECIES: hypothetical protein [unclassified Schlesneria]|uniref:hypothetical protein n=1 Tax=unclassified Schlesneria TaxID=2762017 RepID=UPI002EF913D7